MKKPRKINFGKLYDTKKKRVALGVSGVVVFIAYITAACILFGKNDVGQSESALPEYGTMTVENINGLTFDPSDNDSELKLDRYNQSMLNGGDETVSGLIILDLLRVAEVENKTANVDGEDVRYEISKSLATDNDVRIRIVKVVDGKTFSLIASEVTKEIAENDNGVAAEKYFVCFHADEVGEYGVAVACTHAKYAWIMLIISIASIVLLYFGLFVFRKPKNTGYTAISAEEIERFIEDEKEREEHENEFGAHNGETDGGRTDTNGDARKTDGESFGEIR